MDEPEYITIDVELTAESAKAWLVLYKGVEAWIPKSQLQKFETRGPIHGAGGKGTMDIPVWLYDKKFPK